MPLSTDSLTVSTSHAIVNALQTAAGGVHPGFRPVHAKGRLLTGTFTPTPTASTLSCAPHFNHPSTPLTIRFSASTGIPQIPDTDPAGNPRGIALRFHLPDRDGKRVHTDIIAHSTPYFPTRTGAEFLEFLTAATGTNAGVDVPAFLARHPETQRFLQDPKPSPVSFATQRYFGVNAFKFVNRAGDETMVRYRIEPVEGVRYVSDADMASKSANYLFDEVPERLQAGPIEFKLLAQIAAAGDVTDDAQEIWPEERSVVELGRVSIDAVLGEEDSARVQKQVIFDPIPRVEGVEVSGDPLLDVRASLYLISGRQRREAKDEVAIGGGQAEIAKTEAVKAAT